MDLADAPIAYATSEKAEVNTNIKKIHVFVSTDQ